MLFLYIALAIIGLLLLTFLFLLSKRVLFVIKLKRRRITDLRLTKSFFTSLFIPNDKPDLSFCFDGKKYAVCLITTRFKGARYHFIDNSLMQVIIERNFILLPKRIKPRSAPLDIGFVRKSYDIHFDTDNYANAIPYIIPLPAANTVSFVDGAKTSILYNGDTLYENFNICGSKYFLENVLVKEEHK